MSAAMSTTKKAIKSLSLLFIMISLAVSLSAEAQEVIRIGGTGTGTLLIQRVIESYANTQHGIAAKAIIPPLGSNGGLRALADGAIQIAVVTFPAIYPAKPEDTKGNKNIPWVRTPFVFTGRDLASGTNLSFAQIADIYSGRLGRWQDGKQVRLITRTERESDTRIMREISVEISAAVTLSLKRTGMPFAENDIDNQQLLERTQGSFGAIALGQLLLTDSALKPISLDGVAASAMNLQSGVYRLQKPLYLVVSQTASAGTRDFVKYLQSPEVIKIVGRYGFIPM